ncbi:hypothetical protein L1887_37938 [Cichorium endivia]|nr:hypothetical protein L1887_37938 [Cichorium endivia]
MLNSDSKRFVAESRILKHTVQHQKSNPPTPFFFQFRCPSPLISPILRTFLHLHYSSRASSQFSLKKFDLFLFPQGSVFGGFLIIVESVFTWRCSFVSYCNLFFSGLLLLVV